MSTMTSAEVLDVDPLEDPRWETLQSDGGGLFTSSAWLTAVTSAYGFRPRARLVIDRDGAARAGLAYCQIDDLRGRRIVSFPFSDYHQPLGRSSSDIAVLLESFAGGLPARFRMPADRVPPRVEVAGMVARRDLLAHRIEVDVAVDPEVRFASLHPKVRQNIRRSRRAGVEIELSSDLGRLAEFYDLHVGVRKQKYRLLPQPFSFFEAIHAAFSPTGTLTVALARHGGRAIAGIVYLEVGDTLYYKFNASDASVLDVRPNEDLVWAGIELCCRRGLAGIDLGVSDIDQDGLVRYKRKLAQVEHEIVTLVAAGGASDPDPRRFDEAATVLTRLTELFTDDDVPQGIAEQAGALLYPYFA